MNFSELTVEQVQQLYCYRELEYYLEDDDILYNLELLAGTDVRIHNSMGTIMEAFGWLSAEQATGIEHNYWGRVWNLLLDAYPKYPLFRLQR